MNAAEINSPDTNVTESSSGFQRYIPRFSYSSDTGVLSLETEGTKQPDSELATKKLAYAQAIVTICLTSDFLFPCNSTLLDK